MGGRTGRGVNGWIVLAGFAYVTELLLFTALRRKAGPFLSPTLFIGSGLLLCYASTLR